MKALLLLASLLLFRCASSTPAAPPGPAAPSGSPEEVVQRQLDAYNRHDIDAFVATYADDVKLFTHPDKLRSSGIAALRADYGPFFLETPALRATVTRRIVQGNYVIDHEHVTGLPGGEEIFAVAIYEVRDGKIQNVWFLR